MNVLLKKVMGLKRSGLLLKRQVLTMQLLTKRPGKGYLNAKPNSRIKPMLNISIHPTRESFYELVSKCEMMSSSFLEESASDFVPERQDAIIAEIEQYEKDPVVDRNLTSWLKNIVAYIDARMQSNGPTGHDKRHLAKDLTAGFRFALEKSGGFYDFCSIPSFLHDTGRLVEAKFHGVLPYHETSPHHALFSFAIASEFTTQPYFSQIPSALRNHILYAVLQHNKRIQPTQMLKVVTTADSAQLVGPEGIARLLAVQSGAYNLPLAISRTEARSEEPKDVIEPGFDSLHPVEFYLRNLYPTESEGAQKRADSLRALSAAFLLLAAPNDDVAHQIFAPEIEHVDSACKFKKRIDGELFAKAKALTKMVTPVAGNAQVVHDYVFGARGSACWSEHASRLEAAFQSLDAGAQTKLTTAVTFAANARKDQDVSDIALLTQVAERAKYTSVLAQWALGVLKP